MAIQKKNGSTRINDKKATVTNIEGKIEQKTIELLEIYFEKRLDKYVNKKGN